MKLIVAIVNLAEVNNVNKALTENKIKATRINSTGAFLKGKNATFIIGSNDEKVFTIIDVIEGSISTKSRIKMVATSDKEFDRANRLKGEGGATIFVLDVGHFLKI